MDDWTHKNIFDCAWKHFDVIADQRLRTFNFYIVLLAASVGASLNAVEKQPDPFVYFVIGLFCVAIGLIFFIIEVRSRRLLQIPKGVLSKMEIGDHWPHEYRLFSKDNLYDLPWYKRLISYSFAFRATFALHMAYGFVFILMFFCPHFAHTPISDRPESAATLQK